MQEKKICISQCMIVKNEEKNIERALSWGKELMWEQIVVDTGSADQTVEIARRMGAKTFFWEWSEDFAAAKNYAIDKAKGDWIIFLDADEYMTKEDARKLPGLFARLSFKGCDGITALLHNLDSTGRIFSSCSHLRFFRNVSDIRYKRRIHEQLISTSGRELQILDGTQELSIFHTGYQGRTVAEKEKRSRNKRILKREIEEHPADPELLGYMGDECLESGDREEAERWYQSAIQHISVHSKEYDQRSAVTYARFLMLLTEKNDIDWIDVKTVYVQAVKTFPKESDFDYIVGRFFASRGQYAASVTYLERALGKMEQYGYTGKALFLTGNIGDVYDLLARGYYEIANLQKCVVYAVEHLKYERYEMKPLLWLLKAFLLGGEQTCDKEKNEAVMGFIAKLYDVSSLKDRLFLFKTAQKAGCDAFADHLDKYYFTPYERDLLKHGDERK